MNGPIGWMDHMYDNHDKTFDFSIFSLAHDDDGDDDDNDGDGFINVYHSCHGVFLTHLSLSCSVQLQYWCACECVSGRKRIGAM